MNGVKFRLVKLLELHRMHLPEGLGVFIDKKCRKSEIGNRLLDSWNVSYYSKINKHDIMIIKNKQKYIFTWR